MRLGYARVSTQDQDTRVQLTALKAAKCDRVFQEKASGGRWDRPQLQQLLEQLRPDDVLVVWKLDRLSRSLKDLLLVLETIDQAVSDHPGAFYRWEGDVDTVMSPIGITGDIHGVSPPPFRQTMAATRRSTGPLLAVST